MRKWVQSLWQPYSEFSACFSGLTEMPSLPGGACRLQDPSPCFPQTLDFLVQICKEEPDWTGLNQVFRRSPISFGRLGGAAEQRPIRKGDLLLPLPKD